jgi:hypothetical protein
VRVHIPSNRRWLVLRVGHRSYWMRVREGIGFRVPFYSPNLD